MTHPFQILIRSFCLNLVFRIRFHTFNISQISWDHH
jgi:hypothetical protein